MSHLTNEASPNFSLHGTSTRAFGVLFFVSFLFLCCHESPTLPENGQRYQFIVDASSACPSGGLGDLFDRHFVFELKLVNTSNAWTFQLPTGPQISGPNSGNLTLVLNATSGEIAGTISGGGLAADGVHDVGFFMNQHQGSATIRADGDRGSNPLSGTLSGQVSMSIYRSSSGGECTATDHHWQLIRL